MLATAGRADLTYVKVALARVDRLANVLCNWLGCINP
jgi:hypothetical protein